MISVLYIIGGVWLGGAVLMVAALALAARRPMPEVHEEIVELKEAA